MNIGTLEETLPRVEYIIEASSFEQQCLWEKYHQEVSWEQIPSGHGKTVGFVDNRTVFMSFLYANINGVLVLFWHLTSEVCDYRIAEEFLLKNTNIVRKNDLHDAQNNGILQLGSK